MDNLFKQFEALATEWKRNLLFRARVSLTAAYVGVTAFVLIIFSYLLYGALLMRIEETIDEEVFSEFARHAFLERAADALLTQILVADAIVLLLVLACGYFLTTITLKPIQEARARERRFLADAAHELRTPLSVMKSGNEVVLRGEKDLSPRVHRLLTENVSEIDSLTHIANGLLSLASTKEKAVDTESFVDIRQILSSVVNKLTPLAHKRHNTLAFSHSEEDPLTVRADHMALTRAFENLIENAIKYTEKGSVNVALENTDKSALIKIQDTGIGISPDDLSHVMEPFFRADAARTAGGSGLGLSIASEVIEAHDGSITIESELGVGTIVQVTLPLAN